MENNNKKKRVLVTFFEAGFGHVTTATSIADSIEALHDPSIELIRRYTFHDDPYLRSIERKFVKDVKWANTFPWHTRIQMAATHLFGIHNSLPLVVSTVYRRARKRYLQILEEIKPDIIIDTHYLTSFLATQYRDMIDPHVKVVTYNPDNIVHNWWNIRVDKFIVNCPLAFHDALKHDFTRKQLILVPFVTRGEIMAVTQPKSYYREQYGLPQDRFTVMVAAGGYGRSGMNRVVHALLKVKYPITLIAICGTNTRFYNQLMRIKDKVAPHIDLRPYEFVNRVYELNRAADVFLTKGGPNAILDSALMEVPIGVFYCASNIEYAAMHLFTSDLNCGRFFTHSHRIAKWINECVADPSILDIYRESEQAIRAKGNGSDKIATFIQTYE